MLAEPQNVGALLVTLFDRADILRREAEVQQAVFRETGGRLGSAEGFTPDWETGNASASRSASRSHSRPLSSSRSPTCHFRGCV